MLMMENQKRIADWKGDLADSEQEQTHLSEQMSDLREGTRQQAALATAARVLEVISQTMTATVKQAARVRMQPISWTRL